MNELLCATNFADLLPGHLRQRPCTMRDQHLETCLDDECAGCFPRRAARGYLCQHCFEKFEEALSLTVGLVEHLRSIDGSGAAPSDRVSSSMSWKLPVPASWLAADELMEALGAPPILSTATITQSRVTAQQAVALWADPEQGVSSILGAVRAVEYFRRLQTILHRWPDHEVERALPDRMRCHNCQQRGLVRKSPIDYLDDIEVICPSCKHRHDWWQLATQITAAVAAQIAAEAAARKRANK